MRHQVHCLLLQVLAQLVGDWVLEKIDACDVGVHLAEFIELGDLVFAEVEIGEVGKEGEGAVDSLEFVVTH